MSEEVVVAGAGMTAFGKFADSSVRALAEEAVHDGLKDAGIASEDVQIAFFSNAVGGIITAQEMIRGQSALHHTGLLGIPIINVENACASASSAFYLARMAIASGSVDVAIAVGAEKLTHPDKLRSMAAIGTAVDLEEIPGVRDILSSVLLGWQKPSNGEKDAPNPLFGAGLEGNKKADKTDAAAGSDQGTARSPFMDVYALATRVYMDQSGASAEDFAKVAVKNHAHAVNNPKAQYRRAITVEDVLSSRMISSPLTLLMCSPIGDGAACLVLCSKKYAEKKGISKPVHIAASVLLTGKDRNLKEEPVAARAAERAYEIAGIGPDDLNVVELHDAAAPAELILYEELKLCGTGEGPKLLASGDTAIGGKLPVNPSGGLLSKGHPIGATGCAQLVELTQQLRGECGARQVEGAKVALAENAGGFIGADAAAGVVTILKV
ncbi:MAG: thiolase family protein [Actinobacteria bacterium]|nr:thiolase family protein [Actinomycetota bacterium]MCL6105040.1 thiolase family protein [Actinomycetota bacterium]